MYKLCVLGDGGVGKTALTIQLCQNHFVEEYDPTIEDSYRKQVKVDESTCILEILDTAGQEEFTALRDQWIREGEGFILVYDVTSRSSFQQLSLFEQQIYQVKDVDPSTACIPVVIVGNKADLSDQRVVDTNEGKDLATKMKGHFFESSAKLRHNVDEVFFDLVRVIRGGSGGGEPYKKTKKKKWLTPKCKVV